MDTMKDKMIAAAKENSMGNKMLAARLGKVVKKQAMEEAVEQVERAEQCEKRHEYIVIQDALSIKNEITMKIEKQDTLGNRHKAAELREEKADFIQLIKDNNLEEIKRYFISEWPILGY